MASKSDLLRVFNQLDTHKAKTVYGLSDGHIYINGDPKEIVRIANENNLEIYTLKGAELKKEVEEKPEKKDNNNATI